MTKNYFTKEQALKIALNTNVPFSSDDTQHIFNTAQIREMMNLAVETAIGEPVAHKYENESDSCSMLIEDIEGLHIRNHSNDHPYKTTTIMPLYSVKELEN